MSKDTKKEKSKKNDQQNNFMKDLKVELKKVTWPTSKELVSSTATVLFITILLAIIVFVLDFAFEKVNTNGVEKLKSIVSVSENADESQSEENAEVVTEESNDVVEENTEESNVETVEEENTAETQDETEENLAQ